MRNGSAGENGGGARRIPLSHRMEPSRSRSREQGKRDRLKEPVSPGQTLDFTSKGAAALTEDLGELARGDYISRHRNILFLGKRGAGKPILHGPGIEACRKTSGPVHHACISSTNSWSRGEKNCRDWQNTPVRPVIVDNWDTSPFEEEENCFPGSSRTARGGSVIDDEPRIRQVDGGPGTRT